MERSQLKEWQEMTGANFFKPAFFFEAKEDILVKRYAVVCMGLKQMYYRDILII